MADNGSAGQILDAAQQMVQTGGYHAFSYADIAAVVGLRKASIHYHYPGKADLGKALVVRYRETLGRKRTLIEQLAGDSDQRLAWYAQVFRDMLRDGGRLCLCGALAAEWADLPDAVRQEVRAFFAENEVWLAGVLEAGREEGVFRFEGRAEVQAQAFLAALQGAMLLARSHHDPARYCAVVHQLLAELGPGRTVYQTPSGGAYSTR